MRINHQDPFDKRPWSLKLRNQMSHLHVQCFRFHGAGFNQQRGLAWQWRQRAQIEGQMVGHRLKTLQINRWHFPPVSHIETCPHEFTSEPVLRSVHIGPDPPCCAHCLAPNETALVSRVRWKVAPGLRTRTTEGEVRIAHADHDPAFLGHQRTQILQDRAHCAIVPDRAEHSAADHHIERPRRHDRVPVGGEA